MITKTGASLLGALKVGLKSDIIKGKTLGRVMRPVVKGVAVAGPAVWRTALKHPITAAGMAGSAAIAGSKLPDKTQRYLNHVNPENQMTQRGIMNISYSSPQAEAEGKAVKHF